MCLYDVCDTVGTTWAAPRRFTIDTIYVCLTTWAAPRRFVIDTIYVYLTTWAAPRPSHKPRLLPKSTSTFRGSNSGNKCRVTSMLNGKSTRMLLEELLARVEVEVTVEWSCAEWLLVLMQGGEHWLRKSPVKYPNTVLLIPGQRRGLKKVQRLVFFSDLWPGLVADGKVCHPGWLVRWKCPDGT